MDTNPAANSKVTVTDLDGNIVDGSNYTTVFNDGNPCINAVSGGGFKVVSTAKDDSNYTGACTNLHGFNVMKVSIYQACVFTGVRYNGKLYQWDKETEKLTEELNIPYTGSRVAPTVDSLTYKGKPLVNSTSSELHDYKVIYGNANPETSAESAAGACIDVGTENIMTIRYTNTSNFSNWINVYYNIVAADISNPDICFAQADAQAYTGSAITPVVVKQYIDDNGTKTTQNLVENRDYKITYSNNTEVGIANYTITGISPNYTGTLRGWFRIYSDATSVSVATQVGKGPVNYVKSYTKDQLAKLSFAKTGKEGYLAYDSSAWSVYCTNSYVAIDDLIKDAGVDSSVWKSGAELRIATDGGSEMAHDISYDALAQSRYFFGATTSAATDASSPVQVVPVLALKTASGAIATTADAELASLSPSDVGESKGVSFYYGLTAAEYTSASKSGAAVSSSRFIDDVTMLCVYNKENLSKATLSGLDATYNEHIGDPLDLSGDLVVTDANGNKLAYGTDYTLSYSPSTAPTSETDEKVTVTVTAAADSAYYTGTATISTVVHGIPASWTRLYGDDRYDTMQKIVQTGFASADNVVVATGENFPDALAASALAGKLGAPIVLTETGKLSDQAKDVITSLGAKNIYIIGGTSAVSDATEKSIRDIYSVQNVYRYAGATRYETALLVYSQDSSKAGSAWSKTCILTTGGNFPDALSAAPYSYASCSPVFLVDGDTHTLDDATVATIKAGGFTNAVIMGGTKVVLDDVKTQLGSGISVTRFAGDDRYQTSAQFAQWAVKQGVLNYANMAVATGLKAPDALAGGAFCGVKKAVLLLVDDGDGEYCINNVIAPNKISVQNGYIFGGTSAVSTSVEKNIKAACSN